MPFPCAQRRALSLLRLSLLSVFIHRISSDSQNDLQLQSVASLSKNSAEEEEAFVSKIPNLDRLPDLLIINPTFDSPQPNIPGQSVTRRELLLRTLQLRQRPTTDVERVPKVPKAQPLPKLDGQLPDAKQRLISASGKRPKGQKETFASPSDKLRNRPSLLLNSTKSNQKMANPTAHSNSSFRRLKQQYEHSSTEESDSRVGNWPINNQPQPSQLRKPTQLNSPDQQQPFAYQQQSLNTEQNSRAQFRPFQPVPLAYPSPGAPIPSPEGTAANFNGQPPAVEANNFVYPHQQQPQQQQNFPFAGQQQNVQQQLGVPRRLRFYFTPSATTVNSDFTFAPGSPGFACFYGFPVPRYNTPRKRCIPDHPMCGIQFTCVMDVHAVDEWGREVDQWWAEPSQWNGVHPQQHTFGAAAQWGGGRPMPWGQPQQQIEHGRGAAAQRTE